MPRFKSPILAVDDDEVTLALFQTLLRNSDLSDIVTVQDSREVLPLLRSREVSAVLLDLNMPHLSGLELLERIKETQAELPVIVVTAEEDIQTAVSCLRAGAYDYLVKPIQKDRFLSSLKHAIEAGELRRDVENLSRRLLENERPEESEAFSQIITGNEGMRRVFRYLEAVAPSPLPVLITGESGTGKELVARALHELSGRPGRFVAVNVAGLNDTMFLDTLFGHKKGAYTGAESERKGLIEEASEGTLFLDEIGDLEHASQVKLLRLLQEGEYYQLGSDVPRMCDARIVAATNADIEGRQAGGRFREDLFYRLATYRVQIPPLRERLDDVPLLTDHFILEAAGVLKKTPPAVPRELYTLLQAYDYPGNIRELRSMVYDAVTRHKQGVLSTAPFKQHIGDRAPATTSGPEATGEAPESDGEPLINFGARFPTLREVEEMMMDEAMRRAQGNQSVAAKLLGISQSTLSRRFSAKGEGGRE